MWNEKKPAEMPTAAFQPRKYPSSGRVSNHWIELHETGNVAGFIPMLVMDVWEHAFLLDYKPADRPKYIEAFFSNIDWTAVDKRVHRLASHAKAA